MPPPIVPVLLGQYMKSSESWVYTRGAIIVIGIDPVDLHPLVSWIQGTSARTMPDRHTIITGATYFTSMATNDAILNNL